MSRLLLLFIAWLVFFGVARYSFGFVAEVVETVPDPGTAMLVLCLPLLMGVAVLGPRDVFSALADGASARARDLPVERRERSSCILQVLARLSIVVGVVLFLLGGLSVLVIGSGGSEPHFVTKVQMSMGRTLQAPLCGLALAYLAYLPMAAGLSLAGDGLGDALSDGG